MKVTSLAKVTTFLAALALVASAGTAQAQVDKDNGKCRGTIMKVSTKLAATVGKAFAGCVKDSLSGKATGKDCGSVLDYDLKGKVGKAKTKLTDSIGGGGKSKCTDATHADSLAEFTGLCPSPGTVGAVSSFADVAACNNQLNELYPLTSLSYIIDPDYPAIVALGKAGKNVAKCGNAIVKSAIKLSATVGKERGKCQTSADKGGGGYDYSCSTFDGKSKIAGTATKLGDAVTKSCGVLSPAEFGLLGLCGGTTADITACAVSAATKSASGLTATAFEYAGVCPSQVDVAANPGRAPGGGSGASGASDVINTTRLDAGFTGFGQDTSLIDGFVGRVNLGCADATCGSCTVTTSCDNNNCRCDNDVTILCDEPFGPDADDCGGADCNVIFAPPLPISTSGTPVCVVTTINQELSGTADAGTGESSTDVDSSSKVHTGISAIRPCPTCESGTCNGGDNDGGACTVDATSGAFGDLSYDCPPDPVANVSGVGLQLSLGFADTLSTLATETNCDFPLAALECFCAQCSGDTSIACVNNAECTAAGAGTCTASTGASREPNGCASFDCTDNGDGTGSCATGPDDTFCDGFLNENGSGVATCNTNGDCGAAVGGGACTLAVRRPCFNDPIVASGDPGFDGAELAGTFCIPPTSSSAVNGAAGTTGPGRLRIDWDFTGYCSDGTTEYELGGSNCP